MSNTEKFGGDELVFPFVETREMQGESISFGLSKREHFAAMAMQGMLAGGWGDGDARFVADWRDHMAHEAVRHADALLRALRSSKEGA